MLGDQPVALGGIALGEVGMQMTKNGQVVSVGSGAACLGHPLRAAYWLARTMAARGQGLRAGEPILVVCARADGAGDRRRPDPGADRRARQCVVPDDLTGRTPGAFDQCGGPASS
jgi:hypothetical protein